MTIRFLKPWNGYQPDAVVSGLTNEAALIAGGLASDDLDGGNDGRTYEAKLATDASGNVTGLVGPDGRVLSTNALIGEPEQVPELEPVDWFPDRFWNGDASYLYGHSSSSAYDFVRVNPSTRVRTVVTNPFSLSAGGIRSIIVTSVPGTLLAVVGSTTTGQASMRVWRSTNYGDTWSQVLTLGTGTNGASTDVWTLSDRNFVEGRLGWYIGEYNVNGSRTSGGANDGVTLWKSTDQGLTWTEAQVWNNGSHQIRHIHALKKAPDGRILICTGDTDAESALILWDEIATVGNVTITSLGVPYQTGNQRCRIVDADYFDDGYWYYMGDGITSGGNTVSDVGWFRVKSDLSEAPERLDGKISQYTARAVYYSVKFSNGAACYIEENVNGYASGYDLGIWVTNEDRTRIERAGVLKLLSNTTGTITPAMFQVGDTAYVTFSAASGGKGTTVGSASFTVSATKRWCGIRPDAVHPVYWVNPATGADNADSNRGFYPGLPWASVGYAVASNRAWQGGRIIVADGDHEETLSSPITINADQTNAAVGDYLTIEGSGINTTKHSMSAAGSTSSTFGFGAEAVRFEVKDMWLSTKRAVSTQAIFTGQGAATAQTLRSIRARLGGKDIGALQVQVLNSNIAAGGSWNIALYDSEAVAVTVGAGYLFTGDADGPVNVTAYRSVFDGGRGAFNPASTEDIYAEDCLFTNYTVAAIRAQSTATKVPVTKNCRFHSFIGLPQWIDDGTLTEAAQWVAARCTNTLNPSALFDSTSKVDVGASPKDPRLFNYERASPDSVT